MPPSLPISAELLGAADKGHLKIREAAHRAGVSYQVFYARLSKMRAERVRSQFLAKQREDDPRLLPEAVEQMLVDDLLDRGLTPAQVTVKRNHICEQTYGPAPLRAPVRREPKGERVMCPHCTNGLSYDGTEGCDHCSGKGWVYSKEAKQ